MTPERTSAELEPLGSDTIDSDQHIDFVTADLLWAGVFGGFRISCPASGYTVAIQFRDMAGLWWQRTGLNELVRITPDGKRLR